MNIQEGWDKALKSTEIVRPRVRPLHTFAATRVPYVFLSESVMNPGDTVVRKGEVLVEKPALVLPFNTPQFEGFEFGENLNEDFLKTFFMVRGISFPSLKYNNTTQSMDVREGRLSSSINYYLSELQRSEDVSTGLIAGSEEVWQFSILIFTCAAVTRSAEADIQKLFEDLRKNQNLN